MNKQTLGSQPEKKTLSINQTNKTVRNYELRKIKERNINE